MEREIEKILAKKWQPLLDNLKEIEDGSYPGVYLLAWTRKRLTGQGVKLEDIFYVGMSNAQNGLLGRLKQFIKGIGLNTSHSAGMRFYKEYCNNVAFYKTKLNKNIL